LFLRGRLDYTSILNKIADYFQVIIEMHPSLIIIISGIITGLLLLLALFLEGQLWNRRLKLFIAIPLWYGNIVRITRVKNVLEWHGSIWNKVLFSVLALAIVGALVTLVYLVTAPSVGERYTEFYILGLESKAKGYPGNLNVGERGEVLVGIINHERDTVAYRMEVRIDGILYSEIGPVSLANNEGWEEVVVFVPDRAGAKQKVDFLLYRQGEKEVYQQLYLWVDVK